MSLNELLEQKNLSQYRLSKESGVAQTTISDICSGRSRIEKCSAETVYRIARTLRVPMETLIECEVKKKEMPKRTSFEIFKSNVCHLVKDKGDIDFIIDTLMKNEIRILYDRGWYPESFYLLAMVDYLSNENEIPICTSYDDLRCQKIKETIFPISAILLDEAMKTDRNKQECIQHAIPEFLKYNIVESEVRNVY